MDEKKHTGRPANKPPWYVEAYKGAKGRLFRYKTGGGLDAAKAVREESAEIRRNRFLWTVGFLFAVWLYLWIV